MNQQHKQLVNNFISLTSASKDIAEKYLTKSKWNFQEAINRFYDEGGKPAAVDKNMTIPDADKFFQENSVIVNNVKMLSQESLENLFGKIFKLSDQNIVAGHLMINAMQMKKAGQATKQNLYKLFIYTKTKSFKQIIAKMPALQKEIHERKDLFKSMYDGFFEFYSVSKSPTLDFDIATQIWDLYFKHFMSYHKHFIEYLNSIKNKPAKIYRDNWKMVYEFALKFKTLADYSQDDGWPILIDDFIVYLKENGVK